MNKKKSLTLSLLLAIMMVASSGLCAMSVPDANGNYLKNGSFEKTSNKKGTNNKIKLNELKIGEWDIYSKIPSWNGSRNGIEVQTNGTLGFNAQSETNYIELDSKSNSSMKQSVKLDAGDYQFSFWYKPRTNIAGDNTIAYSFGDFFSKTADGISSTSTGWESYTENFTVTKKGNFNLDFLALGDSNSYGGLIDNASIKAVNAPVPSSMILLLSGFAGFAALRRKKNMK